MDNFQFVLRTKEIATLKTKKAREEMMRRIHTEFDAISSSKWSFSINSLKDTYAAINLYKCAKHTLSTYGNIKAAKLPQFITTRIAMVHKALSTKIVNEGLTYAEFTDCFQHDSKVIFNNRGADNEDFIFMKSLIEMVVDNELPFQLGLNYRVPHHYSSQNHSLTNNIRLSSQEATQLYYLEDIKATLPSSITYTVLEYELALLYSIFTPSAEYIASSNERIDRMHAAVHKVNATLLENIKAK